MTMQLYLKPVTASSRSGFFFVCVIINTALLLKRWYKYEHNVPMNEEISGENNHNINETVQRTSTIYTKIKISKNNACKNE